MNYQTKTDELFKKWENKSKECGFDGFCRDGLMFKGEIRFITKPTNEVCWYRKSGDEEKAWHNAPKRVLFLNKDTNNNPNEDIREWIFRQHSTDITLPIFKSIAIWLYGLLNIDKDGNAPDYSTINNTKVFSPFIDRTPVAYINGKKESGGSLIHQSTLIEHLETFREFVKEQILILDPDIIICGGGSSILKDFVNQNIYPNAIKINEWIYYQPENNKVVIDSYHPSYYGLAKETVYSRMMLNYKQFLVEYPKFKESCRIWS